MEWIIDNKEWLLSGAAITIPLSILGWLFSSQRSKQIQKSGDNSTNIQVNGKLTIGGGKDDK